MAATFSWIESFYCKVDLCLKCSRDETCSSKVSHQRRKATVRAKVKERKDSGGIGVLGRMGFWVRWQLFNGKTRVKKDDKKEQTVMESVYV